jgi:hypothetical protein
LPHPYSWSEIVDRIFNQKWNSDFAPARKLVAHKLWLGLELKSAWLKCSSYEWKSDQINLEQQKKAQKQNYNSGWLETQKLLPHLPIKIWRLLPTSSKH